MRGARGPIQRDAVTVPSLILMARPSALRSEASDDSLDESSSESESEAEEDPPEMRVRRVEHAGGVNRVRCMPQRPNMVAVWGDGGRVSVFDLSDQLRAVAGDAYKEAKGGPQKVAPKQIFGGHSSEGWALDWSPVAEGRLAR